MEPATLWTHETVLAADAASASRARDFIFLHLVEHDLLDLVPDVVLVVSELAPNAMRHAQTPFTVILHRAEQSLLVMVQDGSAEAPPRVSSGAVDTAGRGLWIVDTVSRDWGVTAADGAKSVWASFAIPSREPIQARD